MAQQATHLPSLVERAAQSLLLATRVEQLLLSAECRGSEECMQRYRLLLDQLDSLPADMEAQIRAMEGAEAEAHGNQLGPQLSFLPLELLSEGIVGGLQAGNVRGVSRALRAAFDACNTRLLVPKQSPLDPALLAGLVRRSPKLRDLSLQRCGVDKAEVLRAAATHRQLDALHLGIDAEDAVPAAALASSLQQLSRLQTLHLHSSRSPEAPTLAFLPLAPVLEALTRLRALIIDHIDPGAGGALAPAVLGRLTGLHDLRLEHVAISDEANAALPAALPALEGLRVLRLAPYSRTRFPESLAPALLQLTGLRELGLRKYELRGACTAALAPALTALTALTALDLGDNQFGSAIGAPALAAGHLVLAPDGGTFVAQVLPLHRLSSLHLDRNRMGPQGLAALAPALVRQTLLVSLDLCSNHLGVPGAAALAPALLALTALTALKLGYNHLGPEGAAALAPSFRVLTRLKALDFSENNFDRGGCVGLAQALVAAPGLTDLDLEGNCMGTAAAALVPALKAMTGLHALHLSCNSLDAEGAAGLAALEPALRALPALRTLDLGFNNLGAAALGRVLKGLTELRTLNLRSNMLRGSAMRPVTLALAGLAELRHLDLSCNSICPSGVATLAPALLALTRLRILDFRLHSLGAGGCRAPVLKALTWLKELRLECASEV